MTRYWVDDMPYDPSEEAARMLVEEWAEVPVHLTDDETWHAAWEQASAERQSVEETCMSDRDLSPFDYGGDCIP